MGRNITVAGLNHRNQLVKGYRYLEDADFIGLFLDALVKKLLKAAQVLCLNAPNMTVIEKEIRTAIHHQRANNTSITHLWQVAQEDFLRDDFRINTQTFRRLGEGFGRAFVATSGVVSTAGNKPQGQEQGE